MHSSDRGPGDHIPVLAVEGDCVVTSSAFNHCGLIHFYLFKSSELCNLTYFLNFLM